MAQSSTACPGRAQGTAGRSVTSWQYGCCRTRGNTVPAAISEHRVASSARLGQSSDAKDRRVLWPRRYAEIEAVKSTWLQFIGTASQGKQRERTLTAKSPAKASRQSRLSPIDTGYAEIDSHSLTHLYTFLGSRPARRILCEEMTLNP